MVRFLFLRFATSLTHRDRALDTVHGALTIAGGSYSTRTVLTPLVLVHITSHVVYKYIMAGLVNPSSMLKGIP